jgi:hypothetical protein
VRLTQALEQSPLATLRRVASAHGLAHDDASTREELIAALAERLGDSRYLQEQLSALNADERDVLAGARTSGGELRNLLVEAEQPGAADALAARGWLFRVFAAAGPLRGEVLVVPDEVLNLLPDPARRPDALEFEAQAPTEQRWTDPAFNLFSLTSARTRLGGNLEHEVRPWSQEPGGWPWDARWSFLEHLALSAGLLVHRSDGVLTAASHIGRLLDDPPSIAERLWRTYLRDRNWSELQHAGLAADEDLVDSVALRESVSHVLAGLPESGWLTWNALSEWLQRVQPRLVREQLTPRGLVRFQAARWDELEAPLLRYFVLGPLYWLGQVSTSRDGSAMSRRRKVHEVRPEACHWESAADLVAPARAQLGTLLRAERYLVLRERGRISRYHLIQTHAAAALGSGGSIAECRQLLTALSKGVLPSTVEERLISWDQRFGALDIRPAVLLESRSAAELDLAIDHSEVRPFVRARVGPTAAEVAAADALELAAALRSTGYLPRVDAALRLAAEPRRAYAGLIDEQVLEFLLVNLLAFQTAWPERLAELEGSTALLERLAHQFPPARLAELRTAAQRLAGTLTTPRIAPRKRRRRKL